MTNSRDTHGQPSVGDTEEQIRSFVDRHLGEASRRYLSLPSSVTSVELRIKGGQDLEDAVLAELHTRIRVDQWIANEFASLFLLDLMQIGKPTMSLTSPLRRFLDTGDLVNSVFGDLWSDLADLHFESRGQFQSLFEQRMNWKAASQARRLDARTRQERRRVAAQPADLDLLDESQQAPLKQAMAKEEHDRLVLLLVRLNDRDREILTLHLQGRSKEEIATTLGLTHEAARMAIKRAIERARALAKRRGDLPTPTPS